MTADAQERQQPQPQPQPQSPDRPVASAMRRAESATSSMSGLQVDLLPASRAVLPASRHVVLTRRLLRCHASLRLCLRRRCRCRCRLRARAGARPGSRRFAAHCAAPRTGGMPGNGLRRSPAPRPRAIPLRIQEVPFLLPVVPLPVGQRPLKGIRLLRWTDSRAFLRVLSTARACRESAHRPVLSYRLATSFLPGAGWGGFHPASRGTSRTHLICDQRASVPGELKKCSNDGTEQQRRRQGHPSYAARQETAPHAG